MKSGLPIVLIFLFFSCCCARDQNSLTKTKLKGHVKSVTSLTVYIGDTTKTITEFNGVGKATAKRTTDIPETDTSKNIDDYDINGNIRNDNLYSLSNHLKWAYKFDDKNRLGNAIFLQNDKLLDSSVYKYDCRNNIVEMDQFAPNGHLKLKVKHAYKYDNHGRQVEKKDFDAVDRLTWATKYKYDDKGNQIESIVFKEDSILFYKTNTTYDSDGNFSEAIKLRYGPDSNELMLSYPSSFDTGIKFKREDKANYKYSIYDKAGNWLKEELFANSKLYRICWRKIEYY